MDDCAAILVNWNGRELLEKALPSLPEELEIWVVDNASEDGSVKWLNDTHPKVRVITNTRNEGFGRANNIALREITRPYVLLLNSDAEILDGTFGRALAFMRDHPRCALIGANLQHDDGRAQSSVTPHLDLWTECTNRRLMAWLRNQHPKGYQEPKKVHGVIGAAMLLRRAAVADISFFDERFFFFLEETDLCRRLNNAGHEVWHLPGWKVRHSQGQSASKRDLAKRIEFHLSRELYIHKHEGRDTAKRLRNWQERRLWITAFLQNTAKILSLGLHTSRRHEAVRHLIHWYRLGSPENWGLRPEGWIPGPGVE